MYYVQCFLRIIIHAHLMLAQKYVQILKNYSHINIKQTKHVYVLFELRLGKFNLTLGLNSLN